MTAMQNLATDAPEIEANDLVLSKQMADTLHRHYPGHLWAVQAETRQGIARVFNLGLSGQWGFVIKLPLVYSASDMDKQVMLAGGELLERYRLRRGSMNADHLAALPTDFSGNHIADR